MSVNRMRKDNGQDIHQVARKAGVSASTVSRVTNGVATVDKALARRVWKAVEDLGYVPNPQARALVSGRSRTLGLLISEITNPFFPELIQHFEDTAAENDFEIMVGSTNYNVERAKTFIKRLIKRRVEGVAVMTFREESSLLGELIVAHTPIVSIDELISAKRAAVLHINYQKGIHQAVQHLAVLGHRKIGFASGPLPHQTNVRRRDAFFAAAQTIGLDTASTPVFFGQHTFAGGRAAADHFLSLGSSPTAIVCSNDLMAVGLVRGLAQRQVLVPTQMSVIGFDDIHLAEFANPPLSSVRMSREDLARSAVDALIRLRAKETTALSEPINIDTFLVVRESTDIPTRTANRRSRRAGQ